MSFLVITCSYNKKKNEKLIKHYLIKCLNVDFKTYKTFWNICLPNTTYYLYNWLFLSAQLKLILLEATTLPNQA